MPHFKQVYSSNVLVIHVAVGKSDATFLPTLYAMLNRNPYIID
jgi:hypothetical protein